MASVQQCKNDKKLFRGRVRHRSLLQTRLDTAPGRSGSVWGPYQKPFWTIPRRSRHAQTRHKRGLERLQNSLERPKLPTIEFLFIFGSNWPLLGSLACCIRAFHRSFDHTFICSLDLKVSVTRALCRIGIYFSYIQAPPIYIYIYICICIYVYVYVYMYVYIERERVRETNRKRQRRLRR